MAQLHITHAEAHDVTAIHEMISELSDHLGLAHEMVSTEGEIHNALFGPQRQAEVLLARITLERGCTRLEWWVLAEDAQAVAFYERMGAGAKDEWTVFRLRGDSLRALADIPPA
jgi:hypothetical protein